MKNDTWPITKTGGRPTRGCYGGQTTPPTSLGRALEHLPTKPRSGLCALASGARRPQRALQPAKAPAFPAVQAVRAEPDQTTHAINKTTASSRIGRAIHCWQRQRQCESSLQSPMASLTRSNRRAEGFHQLPHSQSLPHHLLTSGGRGSVPRSQSAVSLLASAGGGRGGRQKRTLEPTDRDIDALKPKKTRIAVEILAKHPPPVQGGSVQPPRVTSTPLTNIVSQPPIPGTATKPALAAAAPITSNRADPTLTKHQNKVINGIKQELNRLDPPVSPPRALGRKLRSQEATRFKSELSAYFPDYDEVIGNDPKEERQFYPLSVVGNLF